MINALLTWASGHEFCHSAGFRCYIKSSARVVADRFVFTHDMPQDVREDLLNQGFRIIQVPSDQVAFLLRDRHLAYWEYLNRDFHDRYLITDSKDVIFQEDPFLLPMNRGVTLVSEGMLHKQSHWNTIDQLEAQRNVREFQKETANRPVLNGGVLLGDRDSLRNLLFLLWTNTVRATGRCTDQGVLNYLYYFLERDLLYHVADPNSSALCLTGEAVKEGFVHPQFEGGKVLSERAVKPSGRGFTYSIFHQWDRTEYREAILGNTWVRI